MKQGFKTDQQATFMAHAENSSARDQNRQRDEVSDFEGLIEQTMALFEIVNDADGREAIKERLCEIAHSFEAARSIEGWYSSPKTQRLAIRRLQKALENTVLALDEVAPEYAVTLDCLSAIEGTPDLTAVAMKCLTALRDAAQNFDELYEPRLGAPVDWALEEAVWPLVEIAQEVCGSFPAPTMNKAKGTAPELKSPGAKAIGNLLRGVDANLTDTKIANMLEKVQTQAYPSDDPLMALIRLQSDAEHGLPEMSRRDRE